MGIAASQVNSPKFYTFRSFPCSVTLANCQFCISSLQAEYCLTARFDHRTIISIISVTCIIAASFITVIAVAVQPREHLMKAGKPIVWYAFNRDATLSDVVSFARFLEIWILD